MDRARGFHRDDMPPEAVLAFQSIGDDLRALTPPPVTPAGEEGIVARLLEALKPFARIGVHKSEEGSADVMIGVKVSDIRKARAAYDAANGEDGL